MIECGWPLAASSAAISDKGVANDRSPRERDIRSLNPRARADDLPVVGIFVRK